ncbi:hypothetical protein SRHO_G00295000 [Serrasalmus rhombeus]
MSLKRYMEKIKIDGKEMRPGYKRTGRANQAFDEHMEKELAPAAMFHGLSPMKCCELALSMHEEMTSISLPAGSERKKQDVIGLQSLKHATICHAAVLKQPLLVELLPLIGTTGVL